MVLALEGTSIQQATKAAGAIKTNLELPDAAFSYFTSHGTLDIELIGFYESLMNHVEALVTQQQIIHCARMMYRLYGDIFHNLPMKEGAIR